MKRFIASIMTVFALTACLTACAPKTASDDMTIYPSEFSEETRKVLDIIDDEMAFFDYSVDESVKSCAIDLWICENGQWSNTGSSYGNTENQKQQIAVRITDSGYDIFNINENGYEKASFKHNFSFSDSDTVAGTILSNRTEIVLGREIPLWIKLGTSDTSASIRTPDNFRDSECESGIAVTITFSDKAVY